MNLTPSLQPIERKTLADGTRVRGISELQFHVLSTNQAMLSLLRKLGRPADHRVDPEFDGDVLTIAMQVPGVVRLPPR